MERDASKHIRVNEVGRVGNIFLNILFILLSALCLYPILLIIGTSFTNEGALSEYGYAMIPKVWSLDAYRYVLKSSSTILRAYGITIFSTVAGTVLGVVVNALYAYAISRREFKYSNFFTFMVFFTMLFYGGLVPWYLVCSRLVHITDTIWALILPHVCSAWNIIILKTFFATSVPEAIVESARIDGSSEFRTLIKIVWPISLPGLATIALFIMLSCWNDYWNPLILTNDRNLQTLQLYLYNILQNINALSDSSSAAYTDAGHMMGELPKETARMAMCVITVGPIVAAYPFFQRYFIQGLTIGAVKG